MTPAATVDEVQAAIRELPPGRRILPVAGATKPALSSTDRDDVDILDVSALRGIAEYDPAELTLTAGAATPVAEIAEALGEHGQYLPFDPPLNGAGATLGGVIAAGASGANAFRHGGVRDFVIGVRFVDGAGHLVTGGGKVVKNAAGFDLAKLMVGSIGRLGVMVQVSLKVFPRPRATATLELALGTAAEAIRTATLLAGSPIDLEALDVTGEGVILARLGGPPETLAARGHRIETLVGRDAVHHTGSDDAALWVQAADLRWAARGSSIIRVGLTARDVPALALALAGSQPAARIRFSLAGAAAWIAWPALEGLEPLDDLLRGLGLRGLVLIGAVGPVWLGRTTTGPFGARLVRALDPHDRFLEV
ncbi:MAG: FAD-binding protein [Solirubrobacteraceae bacterium]